MEGPTRTGTCSSRKEVEVDYIQRIMCSLMDSSTSVPLEVESGIGLSSYSFNESYVSPGPNPWSAMELQESAEPNWRSAVGSSQIQSPIQREISADFPWLSNHLDHIISSTGTASSSELTFSKDDACTTSIEPSIETTDQVAWAQSMLDAVLDEVPAAPDSSQAQVRFGDFPEQFSSLTPTSSETPLNSESLSSSLSEGEAELKKGSRKGGEDAAGTSAESTKRKRKRKGEEEDDRSEDPDMKKPKNRPRKKGGVKRVREPRYAIKTRTDTEVMEDGYKWRKYGQKAVKNSPHPRNYYRCTTPNCPVRKRVERCSEDPGLVVTTYEGTHPHQSPSFLGYPGGLQALLANVSHQYLLAGNAPLPPLINTGSAGFPLSSTSSPTWLSQGSIQDKLNVLRAHEQLLRLQQAQELAAIKSEPSFQFPGPSFSNMSDLTYDSTMSHYDPLNKPDQQLLSPLEYDSFNSPGPFPSGALPIEDGATCSQRVSSDNGGLLEDLFRPTNPRIRA